MRRTPNIPSWDLTIFEDARPNFRLFQLLWNVACVRAAVEAAVKYQTDMSLYAKSSEFTALRVRMRRLLIEPRFRLKRLYGRTFIIMYFGLSDPQTNLHLHTCWWYRSTSFWRSGSALTIPDLNHPRHFQTAIASAAGWVFPEQGQDNSIPANSLNTKTLSQRFWYITEERSLTQLSFVIAL